jgi:hypothetical protein
MDGEMDRQSQETSVLKDPLTLSAPFLPETEK